MADTEQSGSDALFIFNKPQGCPWAFAASALVVLGVMVFVTIVLLVFEKTSPRPNSAHPFCCPEVLVDVLEGSDLKINPCKDIFGHACIARTADSSNDFQARPFDPINGSPKTTSAKAIASYYQSCLTASAVHVPPGTDAAKAILKLVPIASPMLSESLLELVLELSLRYGLPSVLDVQVQTKNAGSLHTILHVALPYLSMLFNSSAELVAIRDNIVGIFNVAFFWNVSQKDFEHFFRNFYECRPNDDHTNECSLTPQQTLTLSKGLNRCGANHTKKEARGSTQNKTISFASFLNISAVVTAMKWKQLLGKFVNLDSVYAVFGVPFDVLQCLLQEFLNTTHQPTTTMLALVSSSMHLTLRLLPPAESADSRKQFCELRSKELRPVWIQDSLQALPTHVQDTAIRATYLTLVSTVLRKMTNKMSPQDLHRLANVLGDMRLLLPSEVSPKNTPIPNFNTSFAEAYLKAQEYLSHTRTYHLRRLDVGLEFIRDVEGEDITIRGETLTVPLGIYNRLPLRNSWEPLVAMPTIGILLAGVIWNITFSSDWTSSTLDALEDYRGCLEESLRSPNRLFRSTRQLELSWLSLESCVQACRDNDWDKSVDNTESWNLTRGHVFYLIYVAYHHCKTVSERSYALVMEDVETLLAAVPDYLKTHSCDSTAYSRMASNCSLPVLG
ncbi:hypothetical protein HPB48_011752 [Haemaphysalis longicornis]|uniref:Uncharacterized protein n=1 Tax=Haemaphysalis longicornis TaxID=44386 RepID=A0A9J6H3W3_HAELO|nr:hypothetical protein HPB48_011752 [Haemaphysalis longicornis]